MNFTEAHKKYPLSEQLHRACEVAQAGGHRVLVISADPELSRKVTDCYDCEAVIIPTRRGPVDRRHEDEPDPEALPTDYEEFDLYIADPRSYFEEIIKVPEIKEYADKMSEAGLNLLEMGYDRFGLDYTAALRVLKVAKTIAEMDGSKDKIREEHLAEALQYRGERIIPCQKEPGHNIDSQLNSLWAEIAGLKERTKESESKT